MLHWKRFVFDFFKIKTNATAFTSIKIPYAAFKKYISCWLISIGMYWKETRNALELSKRPKSWKIYLFNILIVQQQAAFIHNYVSYVINSSFKVSFEQKTLENIYFSSQQGNIFLCRIAGRRKEITLRRMMCKRWV